MSFLRQRHIPQREFCRSLGVSERALRGWRTGEYAPETTTRTDIAIWTRGEVPPESWGPVRPEGRARPQQPVHYWECDCDQCSPGSPPPAGAGVVRPDSSPRAPSGAARASQLAETRRRKPKPKRLTAKRSVR